MPLNLTSSLDRSCTRQGPTKLN